MSRVPCQLVPLVLFYVTLEIPSTQPLGSSQDVMSNQIQFSGIVVVVASKRGYCPTEIGNLLRS